MWQAPPLVPAAGTSAAPGLMSPFASASSIMLRPMRSCTVACGNAACLLPTRAKHTAAATRTGMLQRQPATNAQQPPQLDAAAGFAAPKLGCNARTVQRSHSRATQQCSGGGTAAAHLDAAAGFAALQLGRHTRHAALGYFVEEDQGRVACRQQACQPHSACMSAPLSMQCVHKCKATELDKGNAGESHGEACVLGCS